MQHCKHKLHYTHSSGSINAARMKVSILFLATLSVALFLHTLHYSEASELSQLLDREIQELKDAIEKRGKRKPCGFTWNVKKCRRRGRRGRFWGKRVRTKFGLKHSPHTGRGGV